MIYREIKQALTDMEQMFALLEDEPRGRRTAPGAPALVPCGGGAVRFEHVDFATTRAARSCTT